MDTAGYPLPVEHAKVEVDGISFYVALAGSPRGRPVMLLHGFPENAYGWRHQIGPLAAAGFRVIVPDQRGYGFSGKPAGRLAYGLDRLALDVVGIANALGVLRAAVVGHDWGGIVAWQLLGAHPEFVARAAILNAPHPATVLPYALTSPTQALKSAYVAFFQLPWIPEAWLQASDYELLRQALTASSRPGTFTDEDLRVYRQAWSAPDALTAMLNWYRAAALTTATPERRIAVPVHIFWGDQDSALNPALAERAAALCVDCEIEHLPESSHWLHHEDADRVNRALIDFLRMTSGR